MCIFSFFSKLRLAQSDAIHHLLFGKIYNECPVEPSNCLKNSFPIRSKCRYARPGKYRDAADYVESRSIDKNPFHIAFESDIYNLAIRASKRDVRRASDRHGFDDLPGSNINNCEAVSAIESHENMSAVSTHFNLVRTFTDL